MQVYDVDRFRCAYIREWDAFNRLAQSEDGSLGDRFVNVIGVVNL
jgi:hypothetical protein